MLDSKDTEILKLLKENSKIAAKEISDKVEVSIPTVYSRIKKMQDNEVIKNFTIGIDHKKLGKKICGLLGLNVPSAKTHKLASQFKDLKEVYEVYITNGPSNMMLKIRVKDLDELREFVSEISRNGDIQGYHVYIVMDTILDEFTSSFKGV
ncbi:MAG: Lrp/AsnC family transcriptional regulator [Candidatus Heimdallarchaeota archaeon]